MGAVLAIGVIAGAALVDGHRPSASGTPKTGVNAYPPPGSRSASPQSQISLRGISPAQVGTLTVTGSISGSHDGTLHGDSDGNGASFVPTDAFTPGEKVTVESALPIAGSQTGRFSFTVAIPVTDTAAPATDPEDANETQFFDSAPDVNPPKFDVVTNASGSAAGDVFLAPYHGPGQNGPMIVDPAGNLVWFDPLPDGLSAFDFREQTYQNRPVLTWWQGYLTSNGHGIGEGEIYDSSYRQIATVKAGNGYHADLHEFQLTPRGTALVTAYQPVRWDLSGAGGSVDGVVFDGIAQEIDIATGNVLFEWHSLDHVSIADSFAEPKTPYDYFHINSIDEDGTGSLLISARGMHAVYEIDKATGGIDWQLGGKHSGFTGSGTVFNSQHDARWLTPTRLSLFDNGAGVGSAKEPNTRALIIDLDLAHQAATVVTANTAPGVPQSTSQGNVQPLSDGRMFVGWGSQPDMSEFSADGRLLFQAQLPPGDMSYRAYRFTWSGNPTSAPAVTTTATGGHVTAHASWNGATEVASWRLLAGTDIGSLSAVATVPRAGFETTLTAPVTADYVQIQALDADGTLLATSAPVALITP